MATSGPYEVEQKYRLKNPTAFRRKVLALGAKRGRRGHETNELFDRDGLLRRKRFILRLRLHADCALLTLKGPRLRARYKKRLEIESSVEAEPMRKLLLAMGFRKVAVYRKIREEFKLKGATVTIDQMPGHGWFAEIEAPSARIRVLEQRLGLGKADREERTYLEMVYGRAAAG